MESRIFSGKIIPRLVMIRKEHMRSGCGETSDQVPFELACPFTRCRIWQHEIFDYQSLLTFGV